MPYPLCDTISKRCCTIWGGLSGTGLPSPRHVGNFLGVQGWATKALSHCAQAEGLDWWLLQRSCNQDSSKSLAIRPSVCSSADKWARVTCGLTCYRGAEPPNRKKCSRGCLGKCRPEVGCSGGWLGGAREGAREGAWEGAREGARPPCLSTKNRSREPSQAPSRAPSRAPPQAPSRAPHLGPALPQAPPGALFGVRGFGTSVAGQATRKARARKVHRTSQATVLQRIWSLTRASSGEAPTSTWRNRSCALSSGMSIST